jgi:hypothetical protein
MLPVLTGLVLGCARTDPPGPPAPAGDAVVRFDLGAAPMPWGAVPFPSDLYLDANGRFSLGEVPNPRSGEPLFDVIRALVAPRGACTTCAAYAYVDGGLQLDSARTSGEAGPGDPVSLVNVDRRSDDFGRAWALDLQWDPEAGLLAARPAGGASLPRDTHHALVLTDALIGGDGEPVGRAEMFDTLVRFDAEPVIDRALGALADLGVDTDRIVGLAPFRTGDPTQDLRDVAAAVEGAPAPVIVVDRVWQGDELDGLLGVPAEPRPGVDVPPAEGTAGARAIRHDTTSIVVSGRFTAPRFVAGAGADVGPAVRDEIGRPVAASTDEVPFVLIVPTGADTARLPVVVAQHGFNASRTTGFVLADTAGRAGAAVLAIDGYQHGERAASARDERNAMRDLDGPDGFAETSELDVSGRVFGIIGAPAELAFAADLPLGAFLQLAADALSAIRLTRDGDLDALRAADPALADLAFDPDRVMYAGNSMGAVVGTAVAVASPDLASVVLNVAPGSIIDTLTQSTTFRPLAETVLLPAIDVDGAFDEVDRAMALDPTVDLYRWALEPVDPLALARALAMARVNDGDPALLIQLAGHDEVAAPGPSQAYARASGLPGIGDFALAEIPGAVLPTDAVIWRFDGASHGMLENERAVAAWQDPLVPPLVPLDPPVEVVNPIGEVHDQIEAFLRATIETGRGSIE